MTKDILLFIEKNLVSQILSSRNIQVDCITTIHDSNKAILFSWKQYEQIRPYLQNGKSRVSKKLGGKCLSHPSIQDYKWIHKTNGITDCPVSLKDTEIAQKIWGTNSNPQRKDNAQSCRRGQDRKIDSDSKRIDDNAQRCGSCNQYILCEQTSILDIGH